MTDPVPLNLDDDTDPPPAPGDVLLGRVILLVGLIGILCVVGIAVLAYVDKPSPGVLDQLATGALVGLTGLLAARRT